MTRSMIVRAAGVSPMAVVRIMSGQQKETRKVIADAILSVDGRPSKHQALVLSVGTHRRLGGLFALGYPTVEISAALGVDTSWTLKILRQRFVTWETHMQVAEVYDGFGINGGNAKARAFAARRGFIHPMQWDDIDDPFEVPTTRTDSGEPDPVVVDRLVDGKSVPATRSERWAAFELLRRRGMPESAIAERIGVEPRTVQRYSQRARQVATC
ncbi:helix-turn-helix domain-containing protein [Rhodococcus sp. MALMAid1271]|uniref:helix-turn-helix domain-containing protein n=1 Tax=Rhodococcus sp. MALMAid1271 TaxID=3411744 RepID=UPI003B9EFFF7